MTVIVDSPEFAELIDPAATMTEIGSGYQFSEGPAWDVRDQALVFSDIPGDARWRWTLDTGMVRVAWPTLKGNGLAFDLDGSLLVCEQTTSTVSRIRRDGLHEMIAFHHDGITLNSPNDLVVARATAASTSPTPTTGAGTTGSAASASSCARRRACTASRPAAATSSSSATRPSSNSRTGCASPPTRHCSTSTTRPAARSRCTTSPPTDRWGAAGCCSGRSAAA